MNIVKAFTTSGIAGALIGLSAFWVDDTFALTDDPIVVGKALGVTICALGGGGLMAAAEVADAIHTLTNRIAERPKIIYTDNKTGRGVIATTEGRQQKPLNLTVQVSQEVAPADPIPVKLRLSYKYNGQKKRVMLPAFLDPDKLLNIAGPVACGYVVTWKDLEGSTWTDVQYKNFLAWAMNPRHQFAIWNNEANHRLGWRPTIMSFWKAAYHSVQHLEG